MDRCIVLVDAGYLLGAAATLMTGGATRSRLSVDHGRLIERIRQRAVDDTGQPLLRIYWFDGAPDRVPQPEHRRLRVMSRVTVRLGLLTRVDGRTQQKGVDAAIHAQLTELARNKACADIVLITGDGDLLPGVIQAKEHGVGIHLWAVQAADGEYNQSEDLVAEADERHLLDRSWLTQAAIKAAGPTPAADAAAPFALERAALEPESRPQPLPQAPTPNVLAQRSPAATATATLCWSSDAGWVSPDDEVPLLRDLTSAEEEWADREHDMTRVAGEPREVGGTFGARWARRLPPDSAEELIAKITDARPRIPRALDAELLRYAARFGPICDDTLDISEVHRVELRAGFWHGITADQMRSFS
ncbi:NYN domain-containing protein [Streptomyces lydicus]|uniref:NYN domain-containing protein n=1 Tax=Streptomyces lydicus TaxID=47763 RepID=UPI0010137465|nr:NYN domain-containing protein [Streptomyces lydicus]MCZ1012136.1 NYN domain-containing protein [Streptomyces lydicus]